MRYPLQSLASPLAITVLCALAIAYAVNTPDPRPADAPVTEFSAERAMRHVREIAREPHPAGSQAHTRVRTYIADRLAAMGIEPVVQNTTGVGTRYASAGRVYNVLARIPGLLPPRPRGAVLIAVHYDGVAAGPAAADDAAAVAAALETLRALRSAPLLANDVIVLFADGEEAGLLGAAAFVREHPWARDVGVILNFEARGVHGPSLMFETGRDNSDVIRFLRGVPGARATSLSTAVYRALPNDTDLSELSLLDRPAMNFAFIGGVERYHTTEDDTTHLSRGSLQHHGEQMLALARSFGAARLPRPDTRDAVFFDLPLLGILAYSPALAVVWGVVALGLVIAGIVVARRRGAGTAGRDVLFGVLGALLSILLAGALASGASALLTMMHSSLPWGGVPQWRGIYAAAIALLAVALSATVMALARRVAGASGLHLGALLLFAAISMYVAVAAPGGSFLLTWPVLLAATAALIGALAARRVVAALASWLAAAGVIFIIVPLAYLMVCVALGMAGAGAVLLGILTAVVTWLLMPHLDAIAAGHRWRPAAGAALVAVVLLIAGAFTVRTDARRPAGSAFSYFVDGDSGTAWLAGRGTAPHVRAWVDGALVALHGDTRTPSRPRWLEREIGSRRAVAVPAVPEGPAAPTAEVVSDSVTPTARIVTLRVRTAPRTLSVDLAAEAGEVLRAAVDDRPVDPGRYRRRSARWALEYVAPPESGFTVTLAFRPGEQHVISLLARTMGVPPGIRLPTRPEGVLPIQAGDGTLVYRRIPL